MKKSVKQIIGTFILALGLVAGGFMIASQVADMNQEVALEEVELTIDMDKTISVLP